MRGTRNQYSQGNENKFHGVARSRWRKAAPTRGGQRRIEKLPGLLPIYAAAILLAFVSPWISIAIYVMVAVMWLVPDRRIESVFREKSK